MSGHRGHKKSRTGCVRCKLRRVKCSEERPKCAACARQKAECVYDSTCRVSSRQPSDSTTLGSLRLHNHGVPDQPPVVLSPPYAHEPLELPEGVDRRLLELYLLHNYTAVVASTFPSEQGPGSRPVYSVDSPRLAFQHSFLLNVLFAISALHMSLQNMEVLGLTQGPRTTNSLAIPQQFRSTDFAKTHRIYLNQALREQQEALQCISAENAEALGLASILLSIISIRLLPEASTAVGYIPPTQWLRMSSGIRTVVVTAYQLSSNSSIFDAIISADSVNYRTELLKPASFFDPANIGPFRPILDFYESSCTPVSASEEYLLVYSSVLALVGTMYQAVKRKEPQNQTCRRLISFGPLSPSAYISLLERSEPCALAIFAILMGLTKHVEEYWFFHGLAEREIAGIQTIMPAEWQWALQWPLKLLERGFIEAEQVLYPESREGEQAAGKGS